MALQKLACLLTVRWDKSMTICEPFVLGWKSRGKDDRVPQGGVGGQRLGLWWHRLDAEGNGPFRESERRKQIFLFKKRHMSDIVLTTLWLLPPALWGSTVKPQLHSGTSKVTIYKVSYVQKKRPCMGEKGRRHVVRLLRRPVQLHGKGSECISGKTNYFLMLYLLPNLTNSFCLFCGLFLPLLEHICTIIVDRRKWNGMKRTS